ncbi:MAG: tetratricopeptide repeat protein [Thermodesulfobacteriota bacterium]|nr:tetratricopeptide repeat protein [Thermodesulfobacteriota bacterium]
MAQATPIGFIDEGIDFNRQLKAISRMRDPAETREHYRSRKKNGGLLGILDSVFRKENDNISKELEYLSEIVRREPENTKAHLKIAEIYQRKKEKQKAVEEYLRTAEIFYKNDLYPQAMAVYKKILKHNPHLDHVNLKIADIYRQMGFLGDAFSQYDLLLHHYNLCGDREKALEVMGRMANLDPSKFTLTDRTKSLENGGKREGHDGLLEKLAEIHVEGFSPTEKNGAFFDLRKALETSNQEELKGYKEVSTDKLFGFNEILTELKDIAGPSKAYPSFNYHMGVACREMGFIDEAIEQFQVALQKEKEQNPFEAANLLGLCFKERGWLEEARQAFEKALHIEEVPEHRRQEVQSALEVIHKERAKEKEFFKGINEISFPQPGSEHRKKSAAFEGDPRLKETPLR